MKRWFAVLACLFAVAPDARADTPSAAELLERAIAAHGGRAALTALPDVEKKGTTEAFAGRAAGRRWEMTVRERGDGAYRSESTMEFGGRRFTPVEFYDGDVVKRRSRSSWDDLPLDEARESAAHRLSFLVVAREAEAQVEGRATEADVPCWIVSVPDGRDRTKLALAEDDGRLVSLDYPGTSAEGLGTKKDVRRKLVFRDLRKVGAVLLPFDVEVFEDGTPDTHLRFESIRVLDAFDPAWLRVPDPTRRFIPSEELAS